VNKFKTWVRLRLQIISEYKPWVKSGQDVVGINPDAILLVRVYYWLCIHRIKKPVTFHLRDSYHAFPLLWIAIWFYLGSVFGTSCINKVQAFVLMLLAHLFW